MMVALQDLYMAMDRCQRMRRGVNASLLLLHVVLIAVGLAPLVFGHLLYSIVLICSSVESLHPPMFQVHPFNL